MQWTPQSKVLVQGITQPLAAHYVPQMKDYGSQIMAGVAPGQGGQTLGNILIFDLVEEAMARFPEITTALIFVPPYQVVDAALEAMDSGIQQLIVLTPNVPSLDMIHLLQKAQANNTVILGSGSQGLFIPEQLWLGIAEPHCYQPGSVGLVSRSDRLTDDVALSLTQAGLGQSLMVSLGSDSIVGTSFEQWLQVLEEDEQTQAIVLVGHPASCDQLSAAEYIASAIEKPVVAYFPGFRAPLERSLGDATSIIANYLSSASFPTSRLEQQTLEKFREGNVRVARYLKDIPQLVKACLI